MTSHASEHEPESVELSTDEKIDFIFQFITGLNELVENAKPMIDTLMPVIGALKDNPMVQAMLPGIVIDANPNDGGEV